MNSINEKELNSNKFLLREQLIITNYYLPLFYVKRRFPIFADKIAFFICMAIISYLLFSYTDWYRIKAISIFLNIYSIIILIKRDDEGYNWQSGFLNNKNIKINTHEDKNEMILPWNNPISKINSSQILFIIFISNNKLYFEFPPNNKNQNNQLYNWAHSNDPLHRWNYEQTIESFDNYDVKKIIDSGSNSIKIISENKFPWKNKKIIIDESLINKKTLIIEYLNKNCINTK